MADNEKYVTEETLWIERSFSDPDIMELDRCICDVGMTVTERVEKQMDADVSKEMHLQSKSTIPGGKYAVYHFKGHRNDIYTTYQGLFTVWLPQSGCELIVKRICWKWTYVFRLCKNVLSPRDCCCREEVLKQQEFRS